MATLRDLVGHEDIKKSLAGAIALNQVSHAYLFFGPPGVGKKTAGLAFGRALLCSTGEGDACGCCDNCFRTGRGVHPDLHVIRPDGTSIKIRQLREVCGGAVFTSFDGGRQVYLVENAEKMTTEAANSFLKTLEEPPSGVVFILVTDDPGMMPATVLSRCQRFRFNPLSRREVVRVLEQKGGQGSRVELAASLSGGSPGRALELLEGTGWRDRVLELVLGLAQNKHSGMPVSPGEIPGRDEARDFVNNLLILFRDIMVYQYTGKENLLINADRQDEIAVLAGAYGRHEVVDILVTAEETARRLAANVNQRLALDSLLLKMSGLKETEREE